MTYFQGMCFLFGSLSVAAVFFYLFFGQVWKSLILFHICPEKKPAWVMPFAVVFVLWGILTWAFYILDASMVGLIVSLYMTLGMVKMVLFIKKYDQMRKLTVTLVEGPPAALKVMMICSGTIGIGLLWLGSLA